ncbi:bola-like protein, partial [Saccharata proteae CBS 121410]
SEASASGPEPPDYLSEGELHIFEKIKAHLEPVKLEVQDISGGCGSMYALEIESPKFKGLPVIKQHKLVNQVLAEEIKSWHGVQLRTR